MYTHRVPRTSHNIQPKLQTDLLISQIYTRIYWLPLYHPRLNIISFKISTQTVIQKIRYILSTNWLFASFACQVHSPVVYFLIETYGVTTKQVMSADFKSPFCLVQGNVIIHKYTGK